jgi:peroxiredoxin
MLKKFPIFLIITLLASCGFKKTSIVSGKLNNCKNDTLYIKELTEEPYGLFDSVIIHEKGSFKFRINSAFPAFYSIYKNKNSNITLFLKPGDRVNILAVLPDFSNLEITGSHSSEELNKLLKERNLLISNVYALIDSINMARDTAPLEKDVIRYDSLIEHLLRDHKKYSIDYIIRNSRSPVSIIALQQYVGERPIFDFKKDFNYFNLIDSILMITEPNTEAVKFLHNQVSLFRNVQKIPDVGKKAPKISLPDTSGKIVSLDSFKGKYVLLDFWASFCKPCRMEHPLMRQAWWKYHWKGFEIYQVSIDRSKEAWEQAIRQDRLMWYNVSDLKMWNSIVVSQYQFTEIPANFLLDPEGMIIAHNIPADKLDEVLNEVFNNQKK